MKSPILCYILYREKVKKFVVRKHLHQPNRSLDKVQDQVLHFFFLSLELLYIKAAGPHLEVYSRWGKMGIF